MSDERLPYMRFFPADYVRDTRLLSLPARGAWMDLLCHMWHPDRRGTIRHPLAVIARLLQISEGEARIILEEIAEVGVGDVQWLDNGVVSVSCRRIARDWDQAEEKAAEREKKARLAANIRWAGSRTQMGPCREHAQSIPDQCPEQCLGQNGEHGPSNAQTCHSRSQKPYASIHGPNWEGHSDIVRREGDGTRPPTSPSAPPSDSGKGTADSPDPPGLPVVLDFARGGAGIDPKVAETWWNEVEGRGWRDGRGQPIDLRRWRNALTAYALKWRANERKTSGDRPPVPRLVENIKAKVIL